MEFKELGIIEPILKSIAEENFSEPTEIQAKTIPLVMEGKDVIGGSATGSGKTLAFSSGIIANTQRGKGIQALVLTPTRELAEQVSSSIKKFSKFKTLNITEVFGGVSIDNQIMKLRRTDVVVGTPGRILDHMSRDTIDLSGVNTLVLDEADRMFDMGFRDDVEKIIRGCPKERQTLLFSATISSEIQEIAEGHMKNPVNINAESYVDPSKLNQVYYNVQGTLKFSLLVHFLKEQKEGLSMIFCNSRKTVDFVTANLSLNGVNAHALHGGYTQAKRSKVLNDFHEKTAKVLVCTDVAARGLDIKGVTHIYNYDIPKTHKEYIHRVGRTARAGEGGRAINLLSTRDYESFDRVLHENREMKIEQAEVPFVKRVAMQRTEENRNFDRPRHNNYSSNRFSGRGRRR